MAVLLRLINLFFTVYVLMIIIRVVASWFVSSPNAFLTFLARCTDPYLALFRWVPSIGGLDFSPLVALLALWVAKWILFSILGRP